MPAFEDTNLWADHTYKMRRRANRVSAYPSQPCITPRPSCLDDRSARIRVSLRRFAVGERGWIEGVRVERTDVFSKCQYIVRGQEVTGFDAAVLAIADVAKGGKP